MNRIKNNEKGITLVALVVTIIVLLILAGIAISLSIGNNGLFSRAGNAANTWRKAEANEQEEMSNFESLYDETVKELGMGNEDENIEFFLEGEKYTVKNNTTWNEFFCENFPNDMYWLSVKVDSTEHEEYRGCIVKFWDSSSAQIMVTPLRNESNEKQHKDNIIRKGSYRTNSETDYFSLLTSSINVFGTD